MARPPKTFDHAAELAFVDAANPHQWLLTAISLHEQAVALWRNRGRSQLTQTAKNGTRTTWDDTNRATFLLAAFAMENMLKAFLIYGEPAYIAGGLIQGITTHDLVKLSELSRLVPYAARDRWVFEALAEGSTSCARYPCGRDADDVRPEGQFTASVGEVLRHDRRLYLQDAQAAVEGLDRTVRTLRQLDVPRLTAG